MTPISDQTEDQMSESRLAASGRPLGAMSTLTSLFLLLLVFFILLFSVARAQHDQLGKFTRSAFGNVPSAFGLQVDVDASGNASAGFVNAVSQLITGFGAPTDVSSNAVASHNLILLGVPDTDLFISGTNELTERAGGIAVRLAVLLQRRPNPSQHYRLNLHVSGSKADSVIRAAKFAAALYRAGCQADRMAVFVDTPEAGRVYFDFVLTGGQG